MNHNIVQVVTREKAMKRILCAFMAGAFLLVLGACNTVEGAGKDIEKAGEKIQGAAQR